MKSLHELSVLIILCVGLRILLHYNVLDNERVIPLIEFGLNKNSILLYLIIWIFIGIVFLVDTYYQWTLFFFLVLSIIIWLQRYSTSVAFIPHIWLLFVYGILYSKVDRENTVKITVIFVSTIFLAAACHKINYVYLDGQEFMNRYGFLFF